MAAINKENHALGDITNKTQSMPVGGLNKKAAGNESELSQGMDMVLAAVEADNNGMAELTKSLSLYKAALLHFMKSLRTVKDPESKKTLKEKMTFYMDRAELIKNMLDALNTNAQSEDVDDEEDEDEEAERKEGTPVKLGPGVDIHTISPADSGSITSITNCINTSRHKESKYSPSSDYMDNQPDLTPYMRESLINWMGGVRQRYRLKHDTLFMSINLLDRYLSIEQVKATDLTRVGTAALMMAAKYIEIYPPRVRDYLVTVNRVFTRKQLVATEKLMFQKLGFSLTHTDTLDFAKSYLAIMQHGQDEGDKHLFFTTQFILELSLQKYPLLRHKNSILAAAACLLASKMTAKAGWTRQAAESAQYTTEELMPVVQELIEMLNQPERKNNACRTRYSSASLMEVSKLQVWDGVTEVVAQ